MAVTPVGDPGTVTVGVAAAEGEEADPVPAALVAVTVKIYAVPFVKPVTLQVNAPVVEQVLPPGFEVAV